MATRALTREEWYKVYVTDKFWAKVEKTPTCWLWKGWTCLGYGVFQNSAQRIPAHRFSYEAAKGPIPAGLVIDHLCCVTECVNPDHLEAVTTAENNRRTGERLQAYYATVRPS